MTWKAFDKAADLKESVYDALLNWLRERDIVSTKPFDQSTSLELAMDDLDPAKIDAYVEMVRAKKKVSFAVNISHDEVLKRLNLIARKTGRIANAAVWLFAKNPQRWRPSWEIRCLQFWGTEITKPLPSLHTYNGTVFELIDQTLDFVMSRVDFWVGAPKKAAAPTKPEFPDEAIREAIVNAVCHRDYADSGCVQVMLFKDRLEIINPGTLPRGWTAADLIKSHDSKPRNQLLAQAMSWTSYVEKSGSGTRDIISKCEKWGLGTPEYHPQTVDFKTIIWRSGFGPDKEGSSLTKGRVRVESKGKVETGTQILCEMLLGLLGGRELGKKEMAKALGYDKVFGYLSRSVAAMVDDDIIELTIPDKPNSRLQKYRLTDKGRKFVEEVSSKSISKSESKTKVKAR